MYNNIKDLKRRFEEMKEHNFKYIHITLNIKSVKKEKITDALRDISYGFNRLTKRKSFMNISQGWFRVLEVPQNVKNTEYYPHIHCIIAVKPSYFTSRKYINHKEWMELWQKCMQVEYIPAVFVNTIKPEHDIDFEYINRTTETKDLRQITYGGIFREANKKLLENEA